MENTKVITLWAVLDHETREIVKDFDESLMIYDNMNDAYKGETYGSIEVLVAIIPAER